MESDVGWDGNICWAVSTGGGEVAVNSDEEPDDVR